MASLSSAPHHTRSNSLPSTPNVVVSQVDERLRSSESASSIHSKLTHLSDLYDSIDEFLQLPSSKKALISQKTSAEDSLEASIKLLDICSTISEVLVQIKERAQELQSILRRRCSKDETSKEVVEYLKSRKMVMKAVSKALKELKKVGNNDEITNARSKLSECQIMTFAVLESVLVAIAGPKSTFLIKLFKSKRVTSQQEIDLFLVGFEAQDAILHPEQVRSELEKMESNVKDVEQGVERLFRHLIKTRTTILNILNC